jgi:hypothetical protein
MMQQRAYHVSWHVGIHLDIPLPRSETHGSHDTNWLHHRAQIRRHAHIIRSHILPQLLEGSLPPKRTILSWEESDASMILAKCAGDVANVVKMDNGVVRCSGTFDDRDNTGPNEYYMVSDLDIDNESRCMKYFHLVVVDDPSEMSEGLP